MKFITLQDSLTTSQGSTTVLFVANDKSLSDLYPSINSELIGQLNQWIESKDISSKLGESSSLPLPQNERVITLGLGSLPLKEKDFGKVLDALVAAMKKNPSKDFSLDLNVLAVNNKDLAWVYQQFSQKIVNSLYQLTECKSKVEKTEAPVEQVTLHAATDFTQAVVLGEKIGHGMNIAKTLADLPPNIVTPTYLAQQAQTIAAESANVSVNILDEDQMEALGMGSFLSVSKGSIEPGKLICLEYKGGNQQDAPHLLVGKGITFDSGGISLKPGAGMDEMKYDMGGAAAVIGAFKTAIELALPINLVAIIAAAENMPAGHASKPGDIVKAMNGTTIEILNTDAEGRLVLCDALTYGIEQFKPATIVDVATLTGACMMALGSVNSGLFTEDDALAAALESASKQSGDAVWRMPLEDAYQDDIDSNFADIANIGGGRLAGATTAACFLSRFTEGQKWAHLDVAGTAWISGGKNKGASGRPVPTLVQYLVNLSA